MKSSRLSLLLTALAACMLSACSIEETDNIEQLAEDEAYRIDLDSYSELQRSFMADCAKCVGGDMSALDALTAQYQASYRDKDFSEPLALQQYLPNLVFESCAQKALQERHPEVFAAVITRAGLAARLSQRFYAAGNLTDGAFWLQRVVNLQGEKNGYDTAGRVFINDLSTLSSGARLLAQSARLGSTEAGQILLSLTTPSSSYYQHIQNMLAAMPKPEGQPETEVSGPPKPPVRPVEAVLPQDEAEE